MPYQHGDILGQQGGEACDCCSEILGIINGQDGDNITLKNAPKLVQGGVCPVHEAFFQWIEKLSRRHFAFFEGIGDRCNINDSFIRITRTYEGRISLQSSNDCNVYGDVLIARHGVRGPVQNSVARLIDPKWIDLDLIKRWNSTCRMEHGVSCSSPHQRHLQRPHIPLLIDTTNYCLVLCTDKPSYVALSYVWGGLDIIKATTKNLDRLLQPGVFLQPEGCLPRTITDAMGIVRLLGERYLWVDALCILQDEIAVRQSMIDSMSAIYANAELTIIAADGEDADAGLKGIQGLSSPRDNCCVFEWPDGTRINWPGTHGLGYSQWNQRGWTFQEYLFSRRRLIFVADSIRWECRSQCSWEEHINSSTCPTNESCSEYEPDNTPIRRAPGSISLLFPDMLAFGTLVNGFVTREYTQKDDVEDAFSGILTALAPNFLGGFIWCVPVMFLDLALLWRADLSEPSASTECGRRWNPQLTASHARHAPTWSWASWQGWIETASIWRNEDWVLFSSQEWFYNVDVIRRVVPLVRWSTRQTLTSQDLVEVPYQNYWYTLKMRYLASEPPDPPRGWTRWPVDFDAKNRSFSLTSDIDITLSGSSRAGTLDRDLDENPLRYYYTHSATGPAKFCYPVPIREDDPYEDTSGAISIKGGRYLCGSTHRAFLELEIIGDGTCSSKGKLWDRQNPEEPAGRLWADQPLYDDPTHVDLVAISLKYTAKGGERWKQPFGKEVPQLYNLLWVEWINGVAYRKGIAEVHKHIWESLALEQIELVLG